MRLRPLRMDDVAFCLAFANDPELRGWLRFERPTTESQERGWIEHVLHDDEERVWAMTKPGADEPLGLISLTGFDPVARRAELGLGILRAEDRGGGIGGEAIRLVLAHAFDDLDLQRVHLEVLDDNPAARLYERVGFRLEGRLRRHAWKRGAWRDKLIMGILAEERSP